MLFTRTNQHLQGVEKMQGQLMAMGNIIERMEPLYFANVIWAVFDDQCRHFNECLPESTFTGGQGRQIVWPRTDLIDLSMMMRMNQPLNHLTLPTEWKEWAREDHHTKEKSTPRGQEDRYKVPAEYQYDRK